MSVLHAQSDTFSIRTKFAPPSAIPVESGMVMASVPAATLDTKLSMEAVSSSLLPSRPTPTQIPSAAIGIHQFASPVPIGAILMWREYALPSVITAIHGIDLMVLA